MSNERVNIFIDGGNFYHLALRKLGSSESNFDFEKFATFLANGRKISDMGKRFYIGTVSERPGDQRSKEAMSKQTALFTRLREKGIDVKLATDLIVGAIDDKYDVAVVVSSDADLVPAIDWARSRTHKKVEYIGFSITDDEDKKKSATPSLTLMVKTDIQRTLVMSDLKPFIQEALL